MLVASLALAIGLAIFDITIRELDLSSTATQSQYAIYSADTGAECALYWDAKAPMQNGVPSVFGTSTASSWPASGISCAGVDIAAAPWTVDKTASAATTTFTVQFSPQSYCATVTVAKYGTAAQPRTTVTSHGYNTCISGAAVRLERALQVNY